MKKIVVLNGSPRATGNTQELVKHFQKGAEAAGHQVTGMSICCNMLAGLILARYFVVVYSTVAILLEIPSYRKLTNSVKISKILI